MSMMKNSNHFEYYKQVCEWDIPIKKKVRILGELMASAYDDHWRVVGITKEALNVFQAHNFKKVSRMGINRGHIYDRNETFTYMLENPGAFETAEDWWNFFYNRDKTILMTGTENMSGNLSEHYEVPEGLFHNSGFGWRHGKEEVEFLTELISEHGR